MLKNDYLSEALYGNGICRNEIYRNLDDLRIWAVQNLFYR